MIIITHLLHRSTLLKLLLIIVQKYFSLGLRPQQQSKVSLLSLENLIKRQEILLGNITVELQGLRNTNDELSKEIVRLRSLETSSKVKTNKTNKTPSTVQGEFGDNIPTKCNDLIYQIFYPQPPSVSSPSFFHLPV